MSTINRKSVSIPELRRLLTSPRAGRLFSGVDAPAPAAAKKPAARSPAPVVAKKPAARPPPPAATKAPAAPPPDLPPPPPLADAPLVLHGIDAADLARRLDAPRATIRAAPSSSSLPRCSRSGSGS